MRLWRALEQIPGLSAVRDEWRRWLDDDLPWVEQHLLRPTGERATLYPSTCGEPFRVVDHGEGSYKAVHPDGEPPLELTTSDINILRLDMVRLGELLRAAFGFEAEPLVRARTTGQCCIGTWQATTKTTCPVWLCIQPDLSSLHDSLRQLIAESDGPFVVLTPGPLGDAVLDRTLKHRIGCHVPLSSAVDSARADSLAVSTVGRSVLSKFRRSVRMFEAAASLSSSDDPYEWAHQVELVRATNQVLGEGMLDKGVLSRACKADIETNGKTGRASRVRVRSFLTWMSRRFEIGKDEEDQVQNAVIGVIRSRNC